jgi:hypothetical protein
VETRTPRVWALLGHRAGDNAQVMALAEALGWPFEAKHFAYRKHGFVPSLLARPSLAGIDRRLSSELTPPWPDLVISSGYRNEPICHWIRQQCQDKPVRLVHVGRPWSSLARFDLVVTTPQYRLPDLPNVLQNMTPMHRVTRERLDADAVAWAPRLAHLPRPYIAVVIGGRSGPFAFDHRAAERLAAEASRLARAQGGSLLVTTSSRTPAATVDALETHLNAPSVLYRWVRGAKDNPYFGFLGLADSIVVTGDSMSMLSEACATEKPVYMFDLGEGEGSMRAGARIGVDTPPPSAARGGWRWPAWVNVQAFLYRLMMRIGPKRLSRDITLVHRYLIEGGHAVWLGDAFPEVAPHAPRCRERAVMRVRELFGEQDAFVPKTAVRRRRRVALPTA